MDKPVMKKEVALTRFPDTIYFYATSDAAAEMRQFGKVRPWADENRYQLTVDSRFDYDEVKAYIEHYGDEAS